MPMKLCANISFMFQESSSLLDRYKLAKEAGFKAVECAFPYEFLPDKVSAAKANAAVEQILINAYPGNWTSGDRGLAAIPERKMEFEESIKKSVEYAKKLDCKRIHIMSGVVDKETPQHGATYMENLSFAAKLLEKNGIVGVIEPINHHTMPRYFLNSFEKAVTVIQAINSPYLRLQLDLFHLQQICGNLSRNIETLFPYIGHIQIAQVPSRHEPNSPGEIDYKYIFSLLDKLGYDGWIGLEYVPEGNTVNGLQWITQFGCAL